MTGFRYRLFLPDGTDAGVLETMVPNWSAGETFTTGDGRRYRIVRMVGLEDRRSPFNGLWEVVPVAGG